MWPYAVLHIREQTNAQMCQCPLLKESATAPTRHVCHLSYTVKMRHSITHVALVVRDYDEAIEFYTKKLNFRLVEDTYQPEQDKRWVVVAPPNSDGASLLLARASKPVQEPFVGNQAGGRVFLFLRTDDFDRDYDEMVARGVTFVREPKVEPYGTVAVFEDLYGNLWDLVGPGSGPADPRPLH